MAFSSFLFTAMNDGCVASSATNFGSMFEHVVYLCHQVVSGWAMWEVVFRARRTLENVGRQLHGQVDLHALPRGNQTSSVVSTLNAIASKSGFADASVDFPGVALDFFLPSRFQTICIDITMVRLDATVLGN